MKGAYRIVPKEELFSRIGRLQQKMNEKEIEGILILQNVDLFYFSGTMQGGLMYIPQEGTPSLWIRKSISRAREDSPFPVEPLGSMKTWQEELEKRFGKLHTVGLEWDVLPYNQVERMRHAFSGIQWVDASPLIREVRMIKSPYEVSILEEAARIGHEGIMAGIGKIPSGIREIDLAATIEQAIRVRGHIAATRTRGFNQELVLGAVVSGHEASLPSYFDGPAGGEGLTPAAPAGAGWSPIRPNEPILIDFCTSYEGYNFDQTRTAVWGHLDPLLEEAYSYTLRILREVERMAKPGVVAEALYFRAVELAQEWGLGEYFMGYGESQVKFLGHGVGLEVDEWPVLAKGFKTPLAPGMTIAVEPKFTFPGKGIVGLENTYLVTDDGIRSLSVTPEEILRIPA
ncbi:M24 family metallopeptidase [Thermicanus aegyptius]|uniref:M24 family metallopeptidase n=1 Tax=Thermicanus aegyptius TaxID=94009 RepID=UPI00042296E3|nr:Xaa-Pro peptidase family protein [Thermicanus aegyptius]